ncbi:MAG: AtpZ/AtpI family protein [Candidatus Doudnabacteria bacterium]|nr:AtpZ/AtpI family protein [Candidatus Doudnabacteria bacterium]
MTNNQKPTDLNKWRMASLAAELGFIIALPLIALGYLGKWLDSKFGTEPWLAVVGILLAILCTTVWLTKRFREILKGQK